jgi:protein CpxP
MQKKLAVATLAICLIAAGSLGAQAYQGGRGGCNQAGRSGFACGENEWCGNQFGPNRPARGAEPLALSATQQERIAAIRAEARSASQVLREQIQDYQEQMRAMADTATFDEDTLRTIAAAKAQIQLELDVARARMRSEIHAVLTPEQQELATKLRAERFDDQGERGRGRGGW